jgi:uncharacterized protein YdiU (UPF0061 family)
MLSTRQLCRSNNQPASYAALTQFAPEPFSPFADLLTVLSRPYEDQETFADYAVLPRTDERVFQTFCGT